MGDRLLQGRAGRGRLIRAAATLVAPCSDSHWCRLQLASPHAERMGGGKFFFWLTMANTRATMEASRISFAVMILR